MNVFAAGDFTAIPVGLDRIGSFGVRLTRQKNINHGSPRIQTDYMYKSAEIYGLIPYYSRRMDESREMLRDLTLGSPRYFREDALLSSPLRFPFVVMMT